MTKKKDFLNKEDIEDIVEQEVDDNSLCDDDSVVEDVDHKLPSSMERFSLKPKPPSRTTNHGTSRKLKLKSPLYKKRISSLMIMPSSTLKSPGDFYSVASSAANMDILQENGVIDPDAFTLQNGTKSNPIITFVDGLHLEKNSGLYGVDIIFVHGIEFNGYSRDAYRIHLDTSPQDFKAFKMAIPIYEYAHFQGQCILLKGPSRSFWLCEHRIYQEVVKKTGKDIDSATKKAL
eukprot:10046110-Ditylum_brightwellii.AAC.1